MKMILNIDPLKSAITSLFSATLGTAAITIENTNTAFQHCAWTVAIIAGLVSAINGVIRICEYLRNRKTFKNEN